MTRERKRRESEREKVAETGCNGIKLQNSFVVNNEQKVRFEETYSVSFSLSLFCGSVVA